MKPEELTRLFCIRNVQYSKEDPLLSDDHRVAIADYINQQILSHLSGGTTTDHLSQLLKHCTLNINYGLNNFFKHKLFEANPIAKKKQSSSIKNHFHQSIGISI